MPSKRAISFIGFSLSVTGCLLLLYILTGSFLVRIQIRTEWFQEIRTLSRDFPFPKRPKEGDEGGSEGVGKVFGKPWGTIPEAHEDPMLFLRGAYSLTIASNASFSTRFCLMSSFSISTIAFFNSG